MISSGSILTWVIHISIHTVEDFMKSKRNLAFIVELFLLFALMLLVTVVLTRAFVSSRMQSLYARHKTEAVIVAERVAEISMSADDLDGALKLISEMEEVSDLSEYEEGATFMSKISEDGKDSYLVKLKWEIESDRSGALNTQEISVYFGEGSEPIYVLESGSFRKEASHGA